MLRIFLLFCLLFYLSSCSKKEGSISEFNLKGYKKVFEEIINPEKIRLKSNFLIVLESPSMDSDYPPIHIIDRVKGQYQYSIGRIGFGPGEISDATSIEFSKSDSTFFIYSSIDKKISEFSFKPRELAKSQIKQRKEFFKAYSVLKFTDSTYVGLTVDSPSRMVEFNTKGDSIGAYGKLINFSERMDLDNFNLSQINMGWFGSNNSKSHFAIANIFTNRIELFNKKSGELNYIQLNPKESMKFDLIPESTGNSVHWDLSTPYQFRDVILTNNLIISLYGGFSQNQINKTSEIAKTVYIFDLEGTMKAKLNLDYSIKSLAVSEDLTKLYGITTDSEPGIVEFAIPSLD